MKKPLKLAAIIIFLAFGYKLETGLSFRLIFPRCIFVSTLILLRDSKKTCQHSRRFFSLRPSFRSISVVCLDLGLMAEVYNQLEHTKKWQQIDTLMLIQSVEYDEYAQLTNLWLIFVSDFFFYSFNVFVFYVVVTCLLTKYKSLRGFINIRKETPVWRKLQ